MFQLNEPRLLLIAGTGRNSGKTTFACNIIEKWAKINPIVAIKVSSHFHDYKEGGRIIIQHPELFIAEETNSGLTKDSSRFLKAGAKKSFFIMAKDVQLVRAFHLIKAEISEKDYLVCESGGMRKFINPGVFLIFHYTLNTIPKSGAQSLIPLSNQIITFDGQNFDFGINNISIQNHRWIINNNL